MIKPQEKTYIQITRQQQRQVTITTRDSSSNIIDGPTSTMVYSMKQIDSTQVADNAVTSDKIADGNVGTAELANLAVTNQKIGANAVTSDKIFDGTISTLDLADGSVTNLKLGSDSVTSDKIMNGAVGTTDLADSAVTNPKLADSSVTGSKIQDDSITSSDPSTTFMKRVTVLDNGPGNAKGWDPNGATTLFTITEANAINLDNTIILANVIGSAPARNPIVCSAGPGSLGVFKVQCQVAPPNTSQLHYEITTLPAS